MENILIVNKKELDKKIKKFSDGGKDKLHVIADFDRTLTKGVVQGNSKITSIINRIALGGYLGKDYTKKANTLFDKYRAIEIDPKIPLEEKKKKMLEWWEKHNRLLIESKLNLNIIKDIIKKEDPYFRESSLDFLDSLNKNKIPLVIMSSSRGDMIRLFLEKFGKMYKNTHIIANNFIFNKEGIAIDYEKPVIHTFNKSESSIKGLPVYNELVKRKNVLLLGDSLGDVDMVSGFDYETVIKIGFLNENVKVNLKEYKKNYDIIILNDGTFDYINELMKKIIR
ncbi:MAG: hypothetical protein WCX73_03705 [Candidatus Pacearchaeota archaeon]|jgi:5'-nucleotidase